MISVCIPVYNSLIRDLVVNLIRQEYAEQYITEILCFDDQSDTINQEENKRDLAFGKVRYHILDQNVGRSRIRNLLAEEAKGKYILFLDDDVLPISSSFLKQYVQALSMASVVCGGHIYREDPPEYHAHYLHWFYGSQREVRLAKDRQLHPYDAFMSGNFLIERELFLDIKFEERIRSYGHEDTVFGLQLKELNIEILHLDNPVYHDGLEDATKFLSKHRDATANLLQLSEQGIRVPSRLWKSYELLRTVGLTKVFKWGYEVFHPVLEQNLRSQNISLRLFDLYRLGYLCTIDSKRNTRNEVTP